MAYVDAILGADYKVDTIRGTAWLTIPPGTQHGSSLKLPGSGTLKPKEGSAVTHQKDTADVPYEGSHYFEISVRVPVALDTTERQVLQQLRAVHQPQERQSS